MTHNATLLLRIIAIVIAISIVGGYTYSRTKSFTQGPVIEILSPLNGATLSEPTINIRGSARSIAYISLNGRQIYTDEDGVFNEMLLLYAGYNIITVRAEDRFGRTTTTTRYVTVIKKDEPPAPPSVEERALETSDTKTEILPSDTQEEPEG